jgi:hypothetical protein
LTRKQRDEDLSKGAVEQNAPNDPTNTSMTGQSGHRDQDPLLKSNDSDYPEPGQNEEHTGEPQGRNELADDSGCNPEGKMQDQDPGFRQKEKSKQSKDDPLAA